MSKKTSKRLDKELARYNIKDFSPELQKTLTETMNRPDFDPDKLAAALEKARSEQSSSCSEDESSPERCPWYESVDRIFMLLAGALFLSCFFHIWSLRGRILIGCDVPVEH